MRDDSSVLEDRIGDEAAVAVAEPRHARGGEEEDVVCGLWGCWRPAWLQVLASKKSFTVAYGLLGMCQFAVSSYYIGIISTIEKRFKMPTRTIGLIAGAADIGYMAVLFCAYFGRHGNKPRWVGAGGCLVGLSAFCRLLPHLIYGPGNDAILLAQLPDPNTTTTTHLQLIPGKGKSLCGKYELDEHCEENEQSITVAIIFTGAQLLHGLGVSTYWSLGVTYLDDNARKDKVAILISITAFMRSLGPMIGFVISWVALEMYVDPGLEPTIGTGDPRWIGAWWYGWIPLGVANIVLSVCIAFFPKTLPRAAERAREAARRRLAGDSDTPHPRLPEKKTMKDFFGDMRRLLNNKLLLLNMLSTLLYMFGMMGYWSYLPKYMETQFHTSASHANIVSGAVGLVFTGIGLLVSGSMITFFKPSARFLAGWNTCVELIDALGHYCYAFIGCPSDSGKFHGAWDHAQHTWNMTAGCNSGCDCTNSIKYDPVCFLQENITFYSPCHAGCNAASLADNGTKVFLNCSCAASPEAGAVVVPGVCPVDCYGQFMTFVILMSLLRFISATSRSGNSIIQFRCVSPEDKSLSIGMMEMALIIFAFLPAPIIYGIILDSVCIVWGEVCGEAGNCWLYDADRMRYYLNFTSSTFLMLAACADLGVFYYAKDLKIYDEEMEEEKRRKKKKKEEKLLMMRREQNREGGGLYEDMDDDGHDTSADDGVSTESELLILRAIQSPVAVKKSEVITAVN